MKKKHIVALLLATAVAGTFAFTGCNFGDTGDNGDGGNAAMTESQWKEALSKKNFNNFTLYMYNDEVKDEADAIYAYDSYNSEKLYWQLGPLNNEYHIEEYYWKENDKYYCYSNLTSDNTFYAGETDKEFYDRTLSYALYALPLADSFSSFTYIESDNEYVGEDIDAFGDVCNIVKLKFTNGKLVHIRAENEIEAVSYVSEMVYEYGKTTITIPAEALEEIDS